MSTLHVENLKGLSSGGNANKIIVPSGQTLDASGGTLVPSAGQVVQYKRNSSYSHSTYSLSASVELDLPLSINITPKFSDSELMIRVTWNFAWRNTASDCGFALRRDVGGSSTGYVQGSSRPDPTRGRFNVGSYTREPVWWVDDAPYDATYNVNNFSVLLMDNYTGTSTRTYTFTAGTSSTGRTLYWNRETSTGNIGTYGGGNCSIEVTEIKS